MSPHNLPDKFAELRLCAEELVQQQETSTVNPADMQHLLQKVHSYKLELESQAEELCAAQRELEQARNTYANLYNDAPVGYFSISLDGEIVAANRTTALLLGLPREQFIGQAFERFLLSEDQAIYHQHMQMLAHTHEHQTCELRLQRPGCVPLYVRLESTFATEEASHTPVYRTVVVDIDERVRAEQALQQAHEDLEQRVIERTAQLQALNESLQAEIEARRQAEAALQKSEHFKQSILDSLAEQVAVLDKDSTIIAVNNSWRAFAESSPPQSSAVAEGANYLQVCDNASGACSEGATEFAAGLRAVLTGEKTHSAVEYPCDTPDENRWFVGHITRFVIDDEVYVVVAHEDITQRKKTETALTYNVHFLETLLDTMPSPVFYQDRQGRYQGGNRLFVEQVLGLRREQVIGRSLFDLPERVPPAMAQLYDEHDQRLLKHGGVQIYEAAVRCADDTWRDFVFYKAISSQPPAGEAGIIGVMLDITMRKQVEEALRESEARMRAVMRNVPVMLFALDPAGCFTLSEGRGLTLLGLQPGELVGQSVFECFPHLSDLLRAIRQALAGSSEVYWEGHIGEHYIECTLIPLLNPEGKVHEVVGVATDLTERRSYQAQIEQLAFTDPLTGLANRRHIYEIGSADLQSTPDLPSQALLFLDLDRFKAINDTMGHDVGDELLTEVAARMRASVRVGDTLARMGGDEFAVLLPHSDTAQALAIAERILAQLAQPVRLRGQPVRIGASIGIAINPGNPGGSKPFKNLLIEADIAMYRAKDAGGGIHLYEPTVDAVDSEHPRIRSAD